MSERAVVVGGSGFVGAAVVAALRDAAVEVRALPAPRLTSTAVTIAELERDLNTRREEIAALADDIRGATIVINAAGVADAASCSPDQALGANSLLPRVIREAAVNAGTRRFVHISSAGVQGRLDPLDESRTVAPFSLYTRSKALGEQVLAGLESTVIFRPTSVHGADRSISRSLVKVARSPFASVAGAGDRPTPQVLVQNVGSAVAFVATYEGEVPAIVMQPWEGLTTGGLLMVLGGREARRVPTHLARWLIAVAVRLSSAKMAANVRRLEMLWFGQRQVEGWLATTTWRAPLAQEAWTKLATEVVSGAAERNA